MNDKNVERVRWSFWLIGFATLVWNAMGCINYLMQTDSDALSRYHETARTLIESSPVWATGAFAIAVFGGALGCLLLLFRKSVAHYLYVASLLGVIVTNIHTFTAGGSMEIWVGSLMSLVVAAFLIWYSKWVASKGWIG
jgi:hypothetical protein